DFWDYTPSAPNGGWWVYGQGTVNADATRVVPDRDVEIYDFDGAMINSGSTPPATAPAPDGGGDGDPVDLSSGLFVMRHTDLVEPDILPISVTRTYRPGDSFARAFGVGMTDLYAGTYLWSAHQFTEADLVRTDGARIHYVRTSAGTGFIDAVFESRTTPGPFFDSHLAWNGEGWDLTLRDGTVLVY